MLNEFRGKFSETLTERAFKCEKWCFAFQKAAAEAFPQADLQRSKYPNCSKAAAPCFTIQYRVYVGP
jgi:hypothetical protein